MGLGKLYVSDCFVLIYVRPQPAERRPVAVSRKPSGAKLRRRSTPSFSRRPIPVIRKVSQCINFWHFVACLNSNIVSVFSCILFLVLFIYGINDTNDILTICAIYKARFSYLLTCLLTYYVSCPRK